jgi:RNA polymerase sigma factor (sigma-70 family)
MRTDSAPTLSTTALLSQASWTRRLAQSLARNSQDADDLVQDAFVSALRSRPTGDRSLRPWLGTVLRNAWFNRARATSRRRVREDAASTCTEAPSTPEQLLERLEAHKLVVAAVSNLDEPFRRTILLRYFEGRTSAEIATILAVPPGTVRWRIKEALDRIRGALEASPAGNRQRWRVLLPLVPAGTATPPRGTGLPSAATRPMPSAVVMATVLAAATALIVASGLLLRRPAYRLKREQQASAPAAEVPSVMPPSARAAAHPVRQPPPRFVAATVTESDPDDDGPSDGRLAALSLEACQREVRRLRVATAVAPSPGDIEPEELYQSGQPNAAAEVELRPLIAALMERDEALPRAYTFDCRTWVCRLLVLESEEGKHQTYLWTKPLQGNHEIGDRTSRISIGGGGAVMDAASGKRQRQFQVYLTLENPLGRVPAKNPETETVPTAAPIPTTRKACFKELELLRNRTAPRDRRTPSGSRRP